MRRVKSNDVWKFSISLGVKMKKKISFNSKCVQDIFIFRVIVSISHTYIHKKSIYYFVRWRFQSKCLIFCKQTSILMVEQLHLLYLPLNYITILDTSYNVHDTCCCSGLRIWAYISIRLWFLWLNHYTSPAPKVK